MSWWGSNWNPDRTSGQQAAQDFLKTGNINTTFGGSGCRSSADCGSGYVCSGGRCVQRPSQEGVGSGAGCGEGEGGGGCNAQVTITQGGKSTDYFWQPTYAADGCTVTGCSLAQCGGGFSDCPGERSCRYDAFGTVNCFCGPPVYTGCSEFCTEYSKTFGEEAAGCSGLVCDECSYCDEIFVSASGTCEPIPSSWGDNLVPCHCDTELPECTKCDENGQRVLDEDNCGPCITLFEDCICGVTVEANCCYTIAELNGGSAYAKCQQVALKECEKQCPDTKPDPCLGVCTDKIECNGPVPEDTSWLQNTVTGVIEAGGQTCYLYTQCNIQNIPQECFECDCNCNDDCGECEVCGDTGECERDPNCSPDPLVMPDDGSGNSWWVRPYNTYTYNRCYPLDPVQECDTGSEEFRGAIERLYGPFTGPYPHSVTMTRAFGNSGYDSSCEVGPYYADFDVLDSNGNVIGSMNGVPYGPGGGVNFCNLTPVPLAAPTFAGTISP